MNNDTHQPTVKESLTVQKPRCPWPVHEWHPNAAYCSVDWGSRFRLFDKDDYCLEVRDFETAIEETKWTRAEALESQMLTAPDRVGVWAIYRNEKYHCVVWIADLSIQNWQSVYEKYTFGWDINDVFQFYYMGPLPTAECEVRHE